MKECYRKKGREGKGREREKGKNKRREEKERTWRQNKQDLTTKEMRVKETCWSHPQLV